MRAAVGEYVDGIVSVARNDYRPVAQMCGNKIAGIRDLAFMGDEYPGAAINPLHFRGEYTAVGIHAAVDAAFGSQIFQTIGHPPIKAFFGAGVNGC
jgi:hypothetical protein